MKVEAMVLHGRDMRLNEPGEAAAVKDEDSTFTSPGISVDLPLPLPGRRGVTITSTTMTPDFMKEIRDEIAVLAAASRQ